MIISSVVACAILTLGACSGASSNSENSSANADTATVQNAANSQEIDLADNPNFKIKDNILIPEGKPLIVDFYADWCGPCKKYAPIFHEVAKKYGSQATFISINVDEYKEIANAYKISSIPATAFILPGGGVMGTEVGIIEPDQLSAFINQLLATNAGDGMGI